jgi:DnaJ-class molecular chaperone
MFQVFGKGMPIKMDDKSLTDVDETLDYGNLVIDLIIDFPESLSEKQSELLTKILVKLPRRQNKGLACQGYYYKEKSAPIKELMNNDSDDEMGESGCIQQ